MMQQMATSELSTSAYIRDMPTVPMAPMVLPSVQGSLSYDIKMVDESKQMDDTIICTICQHIMFQPVRACLSFVSSCVFYSSSVLTLFYVFVSQ
jgi:hypothetical protein